MTTAIQRSNNMNGYGKDALNKFRNFSSIHPILAFSFLTFALPVAMLAAVSGGLVLFALPFILL